MPKRRLQMERAPIPGGVSGQRHAATAAQGARHRPLCMRGQPGGRVYRLRQQVTKVAGIFPDLDTQSALPCGRDHAIDLEHAADPMRQPQTLQARSGQHDGVKAPLIELAKTGVQIAAQRLDAQVGPLAEQLHHAPQARGAHASPLRQG